MNKMEIIDLKDRKILNELELNARISHSQLAKRVSLSKQVVKYRIEKLEKNNIIQGYHTIIDVNLMGKTIYVIYLKLQKMTSKDEDSWIKEINKNKNVLSVAKDAGRWDFSIGIICRNNQELDAIFKEIIGKRSDNIKEKLISSEIESTYYTLEILNKGTDREVSISKVQKNIGLDKEDEKIIEILASDARASLVSIAGKLNMSANGVKEKIKRLEAKKIIVAYKTKINYELLGFIHFWVFVRVNDFNEQLYNQIKYFLKTTGKIESVSRFMGYSDIDFRCYVKDIIEFYQILAELKDKFLENILEIDSTLIFSWGSMNYYPRE